MRTELAKEIQEIKRSWTPKQEKDKDKDKDKTGKGRWKKKGDINGVAAKDGTPTTSDAPWRSTCSQGPQLGRSQDESVGIAVPSPSGSVDSHGSATGGKPGSAPGRKDSLGGQVGASAGGITAVGRSAHPTKVLGEGTDPCTW